MPVAIGMNRKAAMIAPAAADEIVFDSNCPTIPTVKVTTRSTAAVMSHRIWARSSPPDRRSRTTSETRDRTVPISPSPRPSPDADMRTSRSTGRPTGLRTVSKLSRGPGVNASANVATPIPTAVTQPATRHRGVGGCPVGNSRNRKLAIPSVIGGQIQLGIHAPISARGSSSARRCAPRIAHCAATSWNAMPKPEATNIHPIGLLGLRDAIRAPTVPNTTPNAARTPEGPNCPGAAAHPFAADSAIAIAASTAVPARSDHASRDAALGVIVRPPGHVR
jgi:hypothetical protein